MSSTVERKSAIPSGDFDVLVAGGGNAALCAAITARLAGAKVLLLEIAPEHLRAGNTRHTRNLRYMHNRGNNFLTGAYSEEEFWNDLLRVTGGETNEKLARLTIRESEDLGEWMAEHGARWQPGSPPLHGQRDYEDRNERVHRNRFKRR